MNINSSNKCIYCDFNKYIPRPCDNLKGQKKVLLSCSNILGVDGWPASRPNQSNQPYTNGISRMIPPNGNKRYSYILNLITINSSPVRYPPFQVLRIYNQTNPLANKDKINSTKDNPVYWIYVKDIKKGDNITNDEHQVESNKRIMLFSNKRCCGNNGKCYRSC